MKVNRKALCGAPSLTMLIGLIPLQAWAQDAAPQRSTVDQGEIIVTAQKREQALIDVPLSITAITGGVLAKQGATAIEDVQYSVPGLSMTQFSPGQQRPQIRGVSAYSGLPGVGVYLDELPLNLELAQTGQDVRLLDMSRIEVLRGPQGTLYGQGAMGGTIRYITNDVDLSRPEASAGGEVGAIDSGGTDWRGEAMVNLPMVTDQLGARLAGSYQHFGGWIDNPVLGEKNINSGHALTLRGKLAMKFNEDFKLSIMVQHQDLKLGSQNLSDDNQQLPGPVPQSFTSKATLVNAIATYDLGPVTLLSSTGYITRKDHQMADLTATFVPFLEAPPPLGFGFPAGTFESVGLSTQSRNRIFAQEVRVSSNGSGPLSYSLGGFYRNSRTSADIHDEVSPNILPFALIAGTGTYPENSRSWALFGEASYRIVPTLTALVGLRYFHDRRSQDTSNTTFGITALDRQQASFHALSPRFNLSWQPTENVNIYANVAKGFRSGGFNSTSLGAGLGQVPAAFEPDTIWSYEIGGKFQTADRKLVAEMAVYRNDWSNVQSATNFANLPTNFTTNSGKLSGWGADGSINYSPISDLTLTLTAGWNNMEYKTVTAEHRPGDPADYVPRFTGSASAEYRFPIGTLPGFLRLDYQHSDKFQVFLRTFQVAPAFSDKQDILNARLGVSGDVWNASLFVRNILNRDSVIYPAFAALPYPARLQPRTAGVAFSVKY